MILDICLQKKCELVSFQELLEKSRSKLGYDMDRQVKLETFFLWRMSGGMVPGALSIFFQLLAVLEEDGTEVEEDDYFQVLKLPERLIHSCLQTLENNTTLMLLYAGER